MESRRLLTTITVDSAGDATGADGSDTLSLRQAIEISEGTLPVGSLTPTQQGLVALSNATANTIDFAIPASTSANRDVPVPGFDPITQTWRIALNGPLPAITHQVTIDGASQAKFGVPFRYPAQVASQTITVSGSPTGGTFTLTTSAPLPVGTTAPIPYNATAAEVAAALGQVVGSNNVVALPGSLITIAFTGPYEGQTIQPLTPDFAMLTGGTAPTVGVVPNPATAPIVITSTLNTVAALTGNNAVPRLIIDGGKTASATGFVLDASDSILRGLIVDGFGVGVSVPNPGVVGDLIQGDDIGKYPLFPVDPVTGLPLFVGGVKVEELGGQGNSLQGVLLGSTNTTVGGVEAQDGNVIVGNGQQGVSILPGAQGNQVIGNQIGSIGPPAMNGIFFIVPNGSDGIRIADSSNYVGGAVTGAGNLISGNLGDGVHIVGPAATRNNVLGNYIGVGPGGVVVFGSASPGNLGDGVAIDDASDNAVGGATVLDRNVISGNAGAGVRIFGTSGVRNQVQGNYIGLTADGGSALGNGQQGVAVFSASNIIGPANAISANLQGVLLSGAGASGNVVQGNSIGTDSTGTADLGNAQEGVRIDGASNNSITGNAQGSQVISGNNVGVLIIGSTATGNQVLGDFVGTDVTGTRDLGNSQEGVRIENAPRNSIGGTLATDRNLISANHWGVVITGPGAPFNVVQGNFIGTDVTGTSPLGNGNELDGVFINQGSSGNLIGGPPNTSAGNTIAFNRRDGVRIEDLSFNNAILTNSIFANLGLGIDLYVPPGQPGSRPNLLQGAPTLTAVATSIGSTVVSGTLSSTPNTTFTIQFFVNSPADLAGVPEGRQFVGQAVATTGANGVATYSANVPTILKSGQFVTATATDSSGNTSEFSSPLAEVFGTVQFQMASYTVNEGVGTATIVATRSGGSGGLFTVNYATADGSAHAGTAYQPASGTLTFEPGQNSQTFAVTIVDNGQPEGDVTVLLDLSNPTGPVTLGAQSTAVLTILGNQPGTLEFQMADYVVDEAAGTATITVSRNINTTIASVNYSTADGTAVAGTDYVATSGTLNFTPGQLVETFTIPILINPLIKGDVSVLLNLSSPTNGSTLGTPSSAVLVIQPGVLQFEMAGYSAGEAAGTATITVSRNRGVGTATVNYSTTNGTAVAGTDYVATSGTLTFAPGVLVQTFTIPILINPLIKGNETILLNLSSPAGGAILGPPSSAVLVIINDGVDRMGPHVTSVKAVSGPYGVAEIVVSFDEPLDPARAVDLLNYGYSVRIAGRDGKLGTKDDRLVGLCPATYDPTALTVTIPLAVAVPDQTKLLLMINATTDVPGAGVGVSDLLGNLLDGNDDGHPGGPFSAAVVAQPAPAPHHQVAAKSSHPKVKLAKHPVTVTSAKGHPRGHATARPARSTHHR